MNRLLLLLCACVSLLTSCDPPANQSTDPANPTADAPYTIQTYRKNSGDCGADSSRCATIDYTYWKANGKTALADSINHYVEHLLTSPLVFSEAEMPHDATHIALDKAAEQFFGEFKKFKDELPDFAGGYSAAIDTGNLVETSNLVSMTYNTFSYMGGAHPNHWTNIGLFEKTSGREVNFSDFVTDSTGLLQLVEKVFKKQMELPANANLVQEGFFLRDEKYFFLPANIGLTDDGVVFHYNPYEIAAYALGDIMFEIPFGQLKPYVEVEKLK